MLKFMKHQQKLTPERIQKQKELFAYTKACQHGFPNKPSALAYDPELKLLAVATRTAAVTVYGAPGVEFYGQHDSHDHAVTAISFVPGKGQLVTLCDDNSLHLWQLQADGGPQSSQLRLLHSVSLEGKLKRISVISCGVGSNNVLVGTEGGNIYLCSLKTFTFSDNIIYQDVVMQNVPEVYKVNPGPVESLCQHPAQPDRVLIGYQRGLAVLWDMPSLTALQTYVSQQQLESISWHPDGTRFICSHNDGSVTIWPCVLPTQGNSEVNKQPESLDGPNTIYGPFPCKPITKVEWCRAMGTEGSDLLVLGGGMPRGSHGDRNTVTVMHYSGEQHADSSTDQHVTFSLSSRVVDFCVTDRHYDRVNDKTGEQTDTSVAGCLIVLCDEEIVFIDLCLPEWPTLPQPYLCSLHCSAITCTAIVSNPLPSVYAKIKAAGAAGVGKDVSAQAFPISGGVAAPHSAPSPDTPQDLLITGHEDGTVRLWCGGGVCVSLLHTINTATIFTSDELPPDDGAGAEDDDWPPFRKTGLFDPYSDDPRLGIKKVEMCGLSGQLVVAGTAGQVIVINYTDSTTSEPAKLQAVDVNLVAETDNFVWKSHPKLELKPDPVDLGPGVEVQLLLQLHPPASCTSLHLHSEWGLLACGTAHGFALADVVARKKLLAKSTLSSLDLANAADEGPMSRRKSLKKSLRESFRRLRRGRSQRKTTQAAALNRPQPAAVKSVDADVGVRPVERAIEARQQSADYLGSMVRCLHLSKCFIANSQMMSATLWAGTNSGAIFVFTIAIPPSEKRKELPVTVQLGKEIHLKHAAPVLSVTILDGQSRPFPPPLAVKKELVKGPDTSAPHKVLICSEEQFKVFTLPQLKPFCKYKLTAIDGSRVRKIGFGEFVSSANKSYSEPCFSVVTNQGDASVFSLPDCRRQIAAACFKREDINGINSAVFNNRGELIFLTSPSELMRVSLSAANITMPRPTLNLNAGTVNNVTAAAEPPAEPIAVAASPGAATAATAACPSQEDNEKAKEGVEEDSAVEHTVEVVELASGSGGKVEEVNGGDTSLLSGDITIDSIRDHMVVGSNTTLVSSRTAGSDSSTAAPVVLTSTSSTSSVTASGTVTTTKQIITVIKTSSTINDDTDAHGEESTVVSTTVIENNTATSSSDVPAADASPAAVNGTE
ncbi:lethal(2) giant larvae protein homolog 1 isoform X2 [Hyalella azteca]|nr:lethal(2) giant larvae protein homolog 1 isoform X2 [Hyalella azteca]